jgi:chromosome segregation ATPase
MKGVFRMKITLKTLKFKNFKGIRDLTIDFSNETDIFGDNGTGKTTLFDGFTWLLFDKDSANRKDFEIKTLDANGNPIHQLNHEVEGILLIDGRPVIFRKAYSEKWTKQRGKAEREFTGHTTDYFIDGVPTKLKEYKAKIDSLIDEAVFKLLTSPTFFNEQLSWQDRRKTLLEVCGDVSDADVISSSSALGKLPFILNGRSIDDHRKVIASRRVEINKELDKLPVRIDEAERSKPDTDGLNETALQAEIEQQRFEVQSKEAELTRLQSGGEVVEQEKCLRKHEADLLDIRNRAQSGVLDVINSKRVQFSKLQGSVSDIENSLRRIKQKIVENRTQIVHKSDYTTRLREEWLSVNEEQPVPHIEDACPTCGQGLPEDQIQAAHDKSIAVFNRSKSERLERIAQQGSAAKSEADRLEIENTSLAAEEEDLVKQFTTAQNAVESVKHELEQLQSEIQDPRSTPSYVSKQSEIQKAKNKIAGLRQSVLDDVQRVRTELIDLRDELRKKESLLARFDQVRMLDKRINELKQQERKLAAEFERLEEELYLTEEFTRAKVALLEERINSKFRYARFKLFDTQINGGLTETCETMYQGVPYGSLNNAARINIGLDIINALSEHYGITAPIFIDNAESITRLIDTSSQLITLIVPLPFDRLPVTVQDQLIALHESREAAVTAWNEQNQHLRVVTDTQEMKEADIA